MTIRKTNTNQFRETQGADPLLTEVTDICERYGDYIGDALLAELREDNDE